MKLLVAVKGGAGSGNWGHSGRPGLVGGSGGGGAMMGQPSQLEGLIDPKMPPALRDAVLDQLDGIPDKHLRGLKGIVCDVPPGYELGRHSFLDADGKRVNGVYRYDTNIMYIHPNALDNYVTLAHELGHHATRYSRGWARDYGKLASELAVQHANGEVDVGDMGLRRYSCISGREFLADAYTVWRFGTDKQWNGLREYGTAALGANADLERLFGPRLDLPR